MRVARTVPTLKGDRILVDRLSAQVRGTQTSRSFFHMAISINPLVPDSRRNVLNSTVVAAHAVHSHTQQVKGKAASDIPLDTPIIEADGIDGVDLQFEASAPTSTKPKWILIQGVAEGDGLVAFKWLVCRADTSGRTKNDPVYLQPATKVLDWTSASAKQVGYVLGDPAADGYILLCPDNY